LSLVPGFDHAPLRPGEVSPPPVTPWPRPNYSAPATAASFAVPLRRTFSTRMCSLARAGTRPAARSGNGWRLRRRMGSGRRLPTGRPRASRPRSGDLAPRRRRGCSVTSCRPRAHTAIARGCDGHGGKANRKGGR
jgi:hypothetical protein